MDPVVKALYEKYRVPIKDTFHQQWLQLQAEVLKLKQRQSEPTPNSCDVCQIELCQELDAYYGKNPNGKHHCVKCRKLKGIT